MPQWDTCSAGDDQDLAAARDERRDQVSGDVDSGDVQGAHTGSQDWVYAGREGGGAPPGDLSLTEAPSQSSVSTELHPVVGGDPAGGGTALKSSVGPKEDQPPSEQRKLSSQTRLRQDPLELLELLVPPTLLTFDPTEPPGNHPAGPRPPSAPSGDLLPIFTNQRPVDLLATKGQRAASSTGGFTPPSQQRYIYTRSRAPPS